MPYEVVSENYWREENIKTYSSFEEAKKSVREVVFYWIEHKYKGIGSHWGDAMFKIEKEKNFFEESGEVNTREFQCKIISI